VGRKVCIQVRYSLLKFGIHINILFSLDLLRLLFDSELLDQPALLTWLTTTSSITEGMAPHQLVFLVQLAHEYFDILVSNRAFATPVIESCAIRYAEVNLFYASSSFYVNVLTFWNRSDLLPPVNLQLVF
jgi:hypothetical protein